MKELKQIFNKAKDGDILGFLADGLGQYAIPMATGQPCTHVGMIWNVERSKKEVSFNLAEQTFFGGKFHRVKIIKEGKKYYAENYYRLNNSKKIYFKQLSKPLTEKQKKIGLEDAIGQIGKKFGLWSFIFGFAFIEKILPQRVENKINAYLKTANRVCSTNTAVCLSKMGLIKFEGETFYTPYDIIELNI